MCTPPGLWRYYFRNKNKPKRQFWQARLIQQLRINLDLVVQAALRYAVMASWCAACLAGYAGDEGGFSGLGGHCCFHDDLFAAGNDFTMRSKSDSK
jgi:hypothetical protein